MKKAKYFVISVIKKRQVSVARNKLLFLATETCLFFVENIHKHFTFFHISNISFENWKFKFLSLVSKEQLPGANSYRISC